MEWKLEKRPIKDLRAYAKNPRQLGKHDGEHLRKSLEKFGQCEPIVINCDNTVIGGHQRLKTLKKMGKKEVDVYVPLSALDEKEIEELNIRLNRNAGEWDFDILANAWEPADLVEWGFTEGELDIDVETIKGIEEGEDDDQALQPSKNPKTKKGDLYEFGKHRLFCGDSTLPDDVARLLDGAEPVLMVTDPPYGVEYDPSWRGRAGKGQRAAGKVQNDDKVNWALAWSLFPGNVAYVWHAGKYCSEVQKSLEEAEYEIISQIIWMKQHFTLSRGDYHWQHEPCWYAVRKGQSHNWQGSRKESTIWEISNLNAFGKSKDEDDRTAHSTQKPIECMKRPIVNNTQEGDEVYDPFCGSGTTIMACEKMNRQCYAMELDPAYCDIIVERWLKSQLKKDPMAIIRKNGEVIEWELNEEKSNEKEKD